MSHPSPFDHRPDVELGDALRAALSMDEDVRFVRRVAAEVDRVYGEVAPGQWLWVLTRWARPGLVAAMLLIAITAFSVGLWVGRGESTVTAATTLIDPLRTVNTQLGIPALMAGAEAPVTDVVLAVALER